MKKFKNALFLIFIAIFFISCVSSDTAPALIRQDINLTDTKPEQHDKPKIVIQKSITKNDYYKKIFTLQNMAIGNQSLIFSQYKNQTRVVAYSLNDTDDGTQRCKFDEVVKFEKDRFYYEKDGVKITFRLNPNGKNLIVSTNNKNIDFCKNGSLYGSYNANLNFKNIITKYSFDNFTKDMNLNQILSKFQSNRIKKGVGYADKNGDPTTEYYLLDENLEPLFCIIADKNQKILELHLISSIYKTVHGLSTKSNLKDIFNTVEVSKIASKEDKILVKVDEIGAKFKFDTSGFMIKKPYSFDALSPYSPVSRIILSWSE